MMITFRETPRKAQISKRMTGSRKLYVKSFGCQMNVYDSQRMADTLAPEGYVETATAGDADLIILNTCHIREKAAEKVYSELGRMRRLKEAATADGRDVLIAVAGCVAQAEGAEIIRRAPVVDLVVGSQNYHPRRPNTATLASRRASGSRTACGSSMTMASRPNPTSYGEQFRPSRERKRSLALAVEQGMDLSSQGIQAKRLLEEGGIRTEKLGT